MALAMSLRRTYQSLSRVGKGGRVLVALGASVQRLALSWFCFVLSALRGGVSGAGVLCIWRWLAGAGGLGLRSSLDDDGDVLRDVDEGVEAGIDCV